MSDSEPKDPLRNVLVDVASLWWLPLIRGLLLLVLGIYALFQPGMTLATFAQVAGFFLAFDGVMAIIAGAVGDTPSRMGTIVRGVIEVLAGVFVFANPMLVAGLTATIVISVIGAMVIVSGVVEIAAAIQDRRHIQGEGWLILAGILSVLIGIALLVAPMGFGLTLVRVLGALAIVSSIAMIAFAFRLRSLGSRISQG
ncbi:HdeD family acid-resistance protein [Rhodopirellula sp. P2]|uniref:HdeD family acid-resistance protein n=1 Tax=Rhodopirellula sp. P2 TaxID=2127060 RepID=UPI002367478E|nr:DUF308 domain-containing protein [Rhodopirellula sp. P2]WDQ14634.1 DUF308 domain-containing protein [Rhodopirellula sp. P2]